jgi:hypothetical protein
MASWSCSTAACCSRNLDPACCPGSSSSSVNSAIPGSSPCYPGLASMHPVARHPVRKALAGRGCRTAAIPAAAGSCAMRFPWSVQAGRRSFRRRSPFASAPAAPNARASDCFARTTCSPSTASFAAGSTSWPDRQTGTRSRSRTGCRLRSRRPLSKVPLLQLQCVVSFERPFQSEWRLRQPSVPRPVATRVIALARYSISKWRAPSRRHEAVGNPRPQGLRGNAAGDAPCCVEIVTTSACRTGRCVRQTPNRVHERA